MNSQDIAFLRQVNQQLIDPHFTTVEKLVSWMGCIQSQEFASAKWAIANRVKGITDDTIEKAFNKGTILRTHVLRPTWHFVAPEDIRWMLKLTSPKIKAMSKGLHKRLSIDETILKKSKTIITAALNGGKHLTREQLLPFLNEKKINTDDIRLGFLLMDAELDGLICSGPKHGKQFTYALMDERVVAVNDIDREEAIGKLAKTYFKSRGPATIYDFAWWSGLGLPDCKIGIELNKAHLANEVVNGQAYWFSPIAPTAKPIKSVQLLPAFDEYTIAYKYRSDVLPVDCVKLTGNGIFKSLIVVNGQVAGTWNRTITKSEVNIQLIPVKPISKWAAKLILRAAKDYGKYLGKDSKVNET
ncbi:winged helix DNA-binding domain-containing protein [Mucilaginibacter agri]|uniref:Winged helix DNA-binding domain-containing protein n=1 Tax=Mucilaginibacter agri TaxID=2695265 RepID=A0A965ZHG0_9SPHI|nr:winged helix DNA-binding domain-containing protein [Mucilaginibacter agri]NCD70167.1 winged helix DNA-binding domain-containing protein [Mucilaginibacter agri]